MFSRIDSCADAASPRAKKLEQNVKTGTRLAFHPVTIDDKTSPEKPAINERSTS
jgi:hypothetical protein